MPEQLLAAVKELTRTVKDLERTLHREYPKRTEVERRFTTKTQTKTRLIAFVITLIMSLIASFFVSTTMISTCFLGNNVESGEFPRACNILPGYKEARTRSNNTLRTFYGLIDRIEQNERDIRKLRKQVQ